MANQKWGDFAVDHRVMIVPPTPAMCKIAEEIAVLQARHRELEEIEQRRQFEDFQKKILENTGAPATAFLPAPF